MMLVHPLLETPIEILIETPVVFTIENPIALRDTVRMFMEGDSELVLSENLNILDVTKNMEFVHNVWNLEFDAKKVETRLSAEAAKIAEENMKQTEDVVLALREFGDYINSEFELPTKYLFSQETEKILKLLHFSIDTDGMTLPEKLLTYMEVCRQYFGKKLFVFLNLKNFLSKEELIKFYQNAGYEEFYVLLLEGVVHERITERESIIILDKDLCMI